MTKKQIVGLAIRLAAIYIVIYIIRDGTAFIYNTYNAGEGMERWVIFSSLTTSIFLLIAILIYKFPLSLAGKLLQKDANEELKWNASFKDIEVGTYIILGIFVLVTAIPDIFYWGIVWFQTANSKIPVAGLSIEQNANIVVTILELVIGFVLVFGASTIRETIYRVRYLGVNK